MRLIDADALKDYISDRVKAQKGKNRDLIPVGELPIVIDKQPTAYDVKNVEEKLEAILEETQNGYVALALEIVRTGGKE